MRRAGALWLWSLFNAVIAAGLGIFINVATELKTNLWAWVLVGAFALATGVVSAGLQLLSQRKKRGDVSRQPEPSAGLLNMTSVDVRGNGATVNTGDGSIFQVDTMYSDVSHPQVNGWLVFLVLGVSCSIITATLVGVNSVSPRAGGGLSQSLPATPGDTAHALAVSAAWPYITGCASLAQVAMPAGRGKIQDFHAVTDVRSTLAASGAGSWAKGIAYIDLSTVNGQSIHIQNILPLRVRRDLASPAWIYSPDDGCGVPPSMRVFNYDLDAGSFKDVGLPYVDSGSPPSGVVPPTAPLGPGFVISGTDHSLVEVYTSSCRGNYEWNLDIQYVVTGTNTVEHFIAGPFQSYGVANNTTVYRGHQDSTGSIQISDVSKVNGNVPQDQC